VAALMSNAAVFWSATGYGEDARAPWASEHFGMTTAEAMAGGCVPVVIDRAGQRETVRDGVDGFRWSTPEELFARTVQLAGDEPLRERLCAKRCNGLSDTRTRRSLRTGGTWWPAVDSWRSEARWHRLDGSRWTRPRCSVPAPGSAGMSSS
jgi:glycosyltransferase involved in cell wall biosynthesis